MYSDQKSVLSGAIQCCTVDIELYNSSKVTVLINVPSLPSFTFEMIMITRIFFQHFVLGCRSALQFPSSIQDPIRFMNSLSGVMKKSGIVDSPVFKCPK